ncbi:MAG: biotin/lipoyl-containing protein [Candidatus Limnocylindria bacterium]
MSDVQDPLALVRRAAEELLPQLVQRLAQHGLGEIEVRDGDLRVRAVRPADPVEREQPAGSAQVVPNPAPSGDRVGIVPRASTTQGITAPAVGFFVYGDGLGPGLAVDKGDELGHVEVLGVRHDVRAPRRGTVRHLVTEAGEAVEYGQLLIEMEPGE